jgi:hypothetical protein
VLLIRALEKWKQNNNGKIPNNVEEREDLKRYILSGHQR